MFKPQWVNIRFERAAQTTHRIEPGRGRRQGGVILLHLFSLADYDRRQKDSIVRRASGIALVVMSSDRNWVKV